VKYFGEREPKGRNGITKQGKEGVVMISDELYDKLTLKSH
jgi:hypothetical protein